MSTGVKGVYFHLVPANGDEQGFDRLLLRDIPILSSIGAVHVYQRDSNGADRARVWRLAGVGPTEWLVLVNCWASCQCGPARAQKRHPSG